MIELTIEQINKLLKTHPEAYNDILDPYVWQKYMIKQKVPSNYYLTFFEQEGTSCPFCLLHDMVVSQSMQLRSADEGETLVSYCKRCKKSF